MAAASTAASTTPRCAPSRSRPPRRVMPRGPGHTRAARPASGCSPSRAAACSTGACPTAISPNAFSPNGYFTRRLWLPAPWRLLPRATSAPPPAHGCGRRRGSAAAGRPSNRWVIDAPCPLFATHDASITVRRGFRCCTPSGLLQPVRGGGGRGARGQARGSGLVGQLHLPVRAPTRPVCPAWLRYRRAGTV
jgi:hypothetical protein